MTNVRRTEPQVAKANGIELCYDTFGDSDAPPMLLIMGLAAQMIGWDEEFCGQLAARGYHVIRFDNRDIGLSTKFPQFGSPNIMALIGQALMGKPVDAPYALRDMAADSVGLLGALGITKAHVVGVSMGGAIAQEIAINFPDRLRSLTSIMSSTGDPKLPQAAPEAMGVLMAPPPATKEEYFQNHARTWQILRGPGFPLDEARDKLRAERAYERGLNPSGVARQLAAIIASGDRTAKLRDVRVPALIIHGDIDPLVRIEGGHAAAAAIPGAKLLIVEGMGHALPIPMWPQIIEAIAGHAR